jgi:hypothetical protein
VLVPPPQRRFGKAEPVAGGRNLDLDRDQCTGQVRGIGSGYWRMVAGLEALEASGRMASTLDQGHRLCAESGDSVRAITGEFWRRWRLGVLALRCSPPISIQSIGA